MKPRNYPEWYLNLAAALRQMIFWVFDLIGWCAFYGAIGFAAPGIISGIILFVFTFDIFYLIGGGLSCFLGAVSGAFAGAAFGVLLGIGISFFAPIVTDRRPILFTIAKSMVIVPCIVAVSLSIVWLVLRDTTIPALDSVALIAFASAPFAFIGAILGACLARYERPAPPLREI